MKTSFGGKAPLCTCLRVYAERGESHSRGGFPCERSIRPRLSLGCGGLKGDYSRSTAQGLLIDYGAGRNALADLSGVIFCSFAASHANALR